MGIQGSPTQHSIHGNLRIKNIFISNSYSHSAVINVRRKRFHAFHQLFHLRYTYLMKGEICFRQAEKISHSMSVRRFCLSVFVLFVVILQSFSEARSLIPAGATTYIFSDHRMPKSQVGAFCKLHDKNPAMVPMPKLPLVAAAMLTRYDGPATAWCGYENMKSVSTERGVVIHSYCEDIFAPGSENKETYHYAVCE